MEAWKIFLIVVAVLLFLTVIVSFAFFGITFIKGFKINFNHKLQFKLSEYRNDKQRMIDSFSWFDSQKFEEFEIKSHDGLKLKADYLKTENANKIAIFFHGWRGSARNDFSPMLKFYQSLGYNILLVNQRSHGKSQGKLIYFGIKEKIDCLKWVEFVNQKFKSPETILVGVSMGAATVLMASGTNLPKNVKAVIADCGYSSTEEVIKNLIRLVHLPVYPSIWFIKTWLYLLTGLKLKEGEVKDFVRQSKMPTLFIHGTTDKMVLSKMTKENFDAKPGPKEILLIENAPHAGSYIKDTKGYEQKVKSFLKEE